MQRRVLARAILGLTGLCVAAQPHLAAQSFTLEQVLTSPFPEQLTATQHGSCVA